MAWGRGILPIDRDNFEPLFDGDLNTPIVATVQPTVPVLRV